jgi:hypothetical protein
MAGAAAKRVPSEEERAQLARFRRFLIALWWMTGALDLGYVAGVLLLRR